MSKFTKKSTEKAMFIDVVNQKTRIIDYPKTREEMKKLLGFEVLEFVRIGDNKRIIVDEMARLKPKKEIKGWFVMGFEQVILNNALVYCVSPDGKVAGDECINHLLAGRQFIEFGDLKDL
ncbi:MAG: hypothetical protein QM737_02855 [Ferruginibacter sp.]